MTTDLGGASAIPPREPSAEVERMPNNFDALRLLLAAAVLVSHAYLLRPTNAAFGVDPLEAFTGETGFSIGALAVNGFFVLSGYLIAGSYVRSRSVRDYFVKRLLRIYPGFLVAFLLTVTAFARITYGSASLGHTPGDYLFRALTLGEPGWAVTFHDMMINGSMWTIRPEFVCYVLIALLGVAGASRSRLVTTLATLAAWTSLMFSARFTPFLVSHSTVLSGMPRLTTYFLFGSFAFAWRGKLPLSGKMALALLPIVALSCLRLTSQLSVLPPTFAYVLLTFGVHSTPVIRRAARFGDFSYGLYLYASPIQQYVRLHHAPFPIVVDILLVTALTAPFAIASWYLIERVALRWKVRHIPSARAVGNVLPPVA